MNPAGSAYQRRYLRAPLRMPCLFGQGEKILPGMVDNISQGGIYLKSSLDTYQDEVFWVIFALPQQPLFKDWSPQRLISFNDEISPLQVIKVQMRQGSREVERMQNDSRGGHGFIFVDVPSQDEATIKSFVERRAANLIYLLTKIDALSPSEGNMQEILSLARILGQAQEEKISVLRQRVVLDYRSLNW